MYTLRMERVLRKIADGAAAPPPPSADPTTTLYPATAPDNRFDRFAHKVVGWLSPKGSENDWWDSYTKNRNLWRYATVATAAGSVPLAASILSGGGGNNNGGGGGNNWASWAIPFALLAAGGLYAYDKAKPYIKQFKDLPGKATDLIDRGRAAIDTANNAAAEANKRIEEIRPITEFRESIYNTVVPEYGRAKGSDVKAKSAQAVYEREKAGDPNLPKPVKPGEYLTPDQIRDRNRQRNGQRTREQSAGQGAESIYTWK